MSIRAATKFALFGVIVGTVCSLTTWTAGTFEFVSYDNRFFWRVVPLIDIVAISSSLMVFFAALVRNQRKQQ